MIWNCPTCNVENEIENLVCSACQEPRPYTPLQQLIVESADEYYNHLKAHDLGVTKIGIRNRTREAVAAVEPATNPPTYHTHWTLDLGGSLYDLEGFSIQETRRENPKVWIGDDIEVIDYNREQHRLTIRILRNEPNFAQLPHGNLRVVSDLKFLVKNVETWAKENGADLTLPETPYTVFQNEGGEDTPEIRHILRHPVQYVWGPPGTGKTRYALLNAVEQVVLAGGQAAVFAPTNSAVENALEPIIEKGFCRRDEILRLGMPSHSFASKYPECCEEVGVKQKIRQLSEQINAWTLDLERGENAKTAIRTLEDLSPSFKRMDDLRNEMIQEDTDCAHHRKKVEDLKEQRNRLACNTADIRVRISVAEPSLGAAQRELNKYYGSGFRSFLSGFRNCPTREILLNKEQACQNQLDESRTEQSLAERRMDDLVMEEAAQTRVIEQYERNRLAFVEQLNQQVLQLRQTATPRPPITQALQNLTVETLDEGKRKLDEIRRRAEEALATLDPEALKKQIAQFQIEVKRLERSTQEIAAQKRVIGMTLDKYISLFMETPLKCAHKFVDEAGFAPMIKALCLFNDSKIPITFIGDHKQIPPIVENRGGQLTARVLRLWGEPAMCAPWLIRSREPDQAIQENPPEMAKIYPNMHTLNKTYRFGSNLAKLLEQFIYQCGLESGTEHPLKINIVNVRATESPGSKINIEEADISVQRLLNNQHMDAAIITPYKNQVHTIRERLPSALKDQVFTVNKAQGKEWDTVIFSVVDDGQHWRNPWFADFLNRQAGSDKLLNTALSRAKKELIVVCNVNYWSNRADADRQIISQLIRLGQE